MAPVEDEVVEELLGSLRDGDLERPRQAVGFVGQWATRLGLRPPEPSPIEEFAMLLVIEAVRDRLAMLVLSLRSGEQHAEVERGTGWANLRVHQRLPAPLFSPLLRAFRGLAARGAPVKTARGGDRLVHLDLGRGTVLGLRIRIEEPPPPGIVGQVHVDVRRL